MRTAGKPTDKMEPRWRNAVFLGMTERSSEYIVGSSEGCTKVRDAKRLGSEEERWRSGMITKIRGTPWKPDPGRDGTDPPSRLFVPSESDQRTGVPTSADPIKRGFRGSRSEYEARGFLPGCRGCEAIMRKEERARTHNQECRDWMSDFMRSNPDLEERVERAEKRKPGSTTLHRESEKDRMDKMRRKLARKGPATKRTEEGHCESEQDKKKLRFNPVLQPKESAEEQQQAEKMQIADPSSGSSAGVGQKRKREDEEEMEIDEIRLWRIMGYDDDTRKWITQGVGAGEKVKDKLRTQINSIKAYGKWQNEIQAHINEAYSPPRVTTMAERLGMVPGFALDLTTKDEKGEPWDFSKPEKRYKAMQWVKQKTALLLIVSPMCGPLSQLQAANYKRMSDEEVKQNISQGMEHLKFAMQLCRIQEMSGLYFLFEHPRGASSWKTKTILDMARRSGTYTVRGDMCQFGMRYMTENGSRS